MPSQMDVAISWIGMGWDGSLGGVRYRARYDVNKKKSQILLKPPKRTKFGPPLWTPGKINGPIFFIHSDLI